MEAVDRLPLSTRRILAIRLRRLGDTLLTTPVLRALRVALPAAEIDVLVQPEFDAALRGNAHIDRLVPAHGGLRAWVEWAAACRRRRYDAVFDLQASSRTAAWAFATLAPVRVGWRKRWVRDAFYTHLVDGWDDPVYFARKALRVAAAVGVPAADGVRLALPVTDDDRVWAAGVMAGARLRSERPVVAMSVVAKAPRKRWPDRYFAALADELAERDRAQVVLTNGPGQIEQVRGVVEKMRSAPALWDYGPTTLAQLGALYELCDLWIGNDGGPKHIAAAVGCPTVTVIKRGDHLVWVDSDDPRQAALFPAAPADPQDLAAVRVDAVVEAAHALLDRRAHPRPLSRDSAGGGIG
ncbi:glycosyltransferase family 9 protein [Candidatus Binatia bacterium]|nr:glycosyltransferase family 9 protein [Candidatus Binatia bacterium]